MLSSQLWLTSGWICLQSKPHFHKHPCDGFGLLLEFPAGTFVDGATPPALVPKSWAVFSELISGSVVKEHDKFQHLQKKEPSQEKRPSKEQTGGSVTVTVASTGTQDESDGEEVHQGNGENLLHHLFLLLGCSGGAETLLGWYTLY